MGSIVPDRGASRCFRDGKRDPDGRPLSRVSIPVSSSQGMGRRQSQRRAPQDPHPVCSPEDPQDRKQRRKPRCRSSSQQRPAPPLSSQGSASERKCRPPPAADGLLPRRHSHREHKHTGSKGSRHTAAFPCHRSEPPPASGEPSGHGDDDSATDLSDSERAAPPPPGRAPPQLSLRPDPVPDLDWSAGLRTRGPPGAGFHFPDFLPPPFNSWSLSQLALFYNVEGRGRSGGAARPRARPGAAGLLERYLERLLQLEWQQIQTVQEESGGAAAAVEGWSGGPRPADSASSRLSSPRCILQCQRGFPFSVLSCLAGQPAPLSVCGAACCRSARARHARLSPMLGASGAAVSPPRRSYSESRALPPDPPRGGSPLTANSHLRRMQASGNMRNPVPAAAAGGPGDHGDTGGLRRRSGSQRRAGAPDRKQNGWEKRRGGSEVRRAAGEVTEQEVKPDAVAAIKDNLPTSKHPPTLRPGRTRQVDFIT